MILYLDASALVKRYVQERGSEEVVARCPGGHDRDSAYLSCGSRRGTGQGRAYRCD